jgi:hypothetical protein
MTALNVRPTLVVTAAGAPAHGAVEASIDLCDCPDCRDERLRRHNHPLLAAALLAFYDAQDALLALRRSHDCPDPSACGLCHDARMAEALVQPVGCGLEGEFIFADSPDVERRREASERHGDASPRAPRRTPRGARNHPAHEPAVLALMDLGDALGALHEGHGCDDEECYVCHLAEQGAYLAPMLAGALVSSLVPTPALLLRWGADPRLVRDLEALSH